MNPSQPQQNPPHLSDIELVVINAKQLEKDLIEKLGATKTDSTGNNTGFYEKIKQVEHLFSPQDVETLKYIVNVRNIVVHDVNENKLRDRRRFEQAIKQVKQGVRIAEKRKADIATPQPTVQTPPYTPPRPTQSQRHSPPRREQNRGYCFIATAVYGDYDYPKVRVLRQFRDEKLLTNPFGRAFVELYYTLSPPFANWLQAHQALAKPIKKVLDKVVDWLK